MEQILRLGLVAPAQPQRRAEQGIQVLGEDLFKGPCSGSGSGSLQVVLLARSRTDGSCFLRHLDGQKPSLHRVRRESREVRNGKAEAVGQTITSNKRPLVPAVHVGSLTPRAG